MIMLDERLRADGSNKRRLRKVHYAYYDYERGPPHPLIRMGGQYLGLLGFKIGDLIEVQFEPERIVITRVHEPPDENKA